MRIFAILLIMAGVATGVFALLPPPGVSEEEHAQLVIVRPPADARQHFDYQEFRAMVLYATGVVPEPPAMLYSCHDDPAHTGYYDSCLVQYQGRLYDVLRRNGTMMMQGHEE